MDPDIKIYLKPRPANPKFGDRPWMLVRPDFYYGPFFPAWQPVPPSATEAHTVHSAALATALTKFYVELLPRILKCESDIPRMRTAMSEDPLSILKWECFDIMMQCEDLADCRYESVELVFGDKAPPLPPRRHRSIKLALKYWKLLEEAAFTLDLQRMVWATIFMVLLANTESMSNLRTEISNCLEDTALVYITNPLDKHVIPFIDRWMGRGENDRDSSSGMISASTSNESTSGSGAESSTPDNPESPIPKPSLPSRGRPIKPSFRKIKID